MEENGSCFPELIHQESQKLENSVQQFVSQLDQCRETVMVAIDFHTLSEKVLLCLKIEAYEYMHVYAAMC